MHRVLEHSGTDIATVGHYAVIDAGFDVSFADGRTDRAGLILRQAHERAPGDSPLFSIAKSLKVERVLLRYGLTAAGAYQTEPYDAINVQGTKTGALLDFGGYLAMPWFEKPAYHFRHAPDTQVRPRALLSPTGSFIQPDERVRVPFDLWGFGLSRRADPVADNPWLWSHELARDLRDGKATRSDAEQHVHNMLDPVDARLAN